MSTQAQVISNYVNYIQLYLKNNNEMIQKIAPSRLTNFYYENDTNGLPIITSWVFMTPSPTIADLMLLKESDVLALSQV